MTPAQRSAAAKKAFRSRKRQDEALARPVEPVPERHKSKSSTIIDLLAKTDLTREQIAARVGCLPAYVRVVEQRLAAKPGDSPENRWRLRNIDRYRKIKREYMRWKKRVDPDFAERQRISNRNSQRRARQRRAEASA